jgi:hypothetical protein
MNATKRRSLRLSRRIAVLLLSAGALVFTFTPLASAQPVVDAGGSANGTGIFFGQTVTVAVTGTPQAAAGPVAVTFVNPSNTYTGEARCIAIDETATGFRATIAGEITGGPAFAQGFRGFRLTVYDNTPSAQPDRVGALFFRSVEVQTSCAPDFNPGPQVTGDYVITPLGACPPNDDDDGDGLTNNNENLFSTLLGNSDSDDDGIRDGNDDANGNGDDDEDEDDDDECPDEDSDDDGEDDEDEDDDEDD